LRGIKVNSGKYRQGELAAGGKGCWVTLWILFWMRPIAFFNLPVSVIFSEISRLNPTYRLEPVLATFRHARAASAVAALQYDSVKKGTDTISLDEIDAEIKLSRSKRKQ
jgi:hypothetical protein